MQNHTFLNKQFFFGSGGTGGYKFTGGYFTDGWWLFTTVNLRRYLWKCSTPNTNDKVSFSVLFCFIESLRVQRE